MGFNIKNNYGPNIDVHDGGVVNLRQNKDGLWSTDDAQEAEIVEEAEIIEEVKDETPATMDRPDDKTEKTPAEVFAERVKEIMLKAEQDNGQRKDNNARSYTTTYTYHVDGKGFGLVMDELLADYEHVINGYLNGATAETAGTIKYVCPFIGYILDTHLYSADKMPKNEFKKVLEQVYGKGTSAVAKMSDKNPSNEAEVLYKTAKEIMEKHKKA